MIEGDCLEIQRIETNKLIPATYNPRKDLKPEDTEYQKIKKSILEFGFVSPLVVNKDMTVIGGHQRLKVLQELGYKSVECIIVDLDKTKEKALNIALNKISGEWDTDKLESLLQELEIEDFDMELTGFDFDEIDEILKDLTGSKEDNFDVEKALEEIENPITKKGDIWLLGTHRLMCGDSTLKENIDKLINNKQIDLILTDPPYNMGYSGAGIMKETTHNVRERIKNIIDFNAYSIKYLSSMNIGNVCIFTSKDLIKDYLEIFKEWKFNLLVWVKTNNPPMINNNFLPDIEYLLYFHRGKRIWNNGLKPMSIYSKCYVSSRQEGQRGVGDLHPTMKPIDLLVDKIKILSKENGIILDLFGGSGSTLIAAEQTKRTCYMMELDPKYCDVIVKRWEKLTNKKAILEE